MGYGRQHLAAKLSLEKHRCRPLLGKFEKKQASAEEKNRLPLFTRFTTNTPIAAISCIFSTPISTKSRKSISMKRNTLNTPGKPFAKPARSPLCVGVKSVLLLYWTGLKAMANHKAKLRYFSPVKSNTPRYKAPFKSKEKATYWWAGFEVIISFIAHLRTLQPPFSPNPQPHSPPHLENQKSEL